jgi:hypothetical protein
MRHVSKEDARHVVAHVSGVAEGDTVFEAAEKVIRTMRDAGFPAASIRRAEKMLADARAREL